MMQRSYHTPSDVMDRVVLVTGPSGAGRSTAMAILEDLGFEAIDNLPLGLIPNLSEDVPRARPLALGLDVRNRDFSAARVLDAAERFGRGGHTSVDVLYLDCRLEVLQARYSQTRRRHPLAPTQAAAVGIAEDMALMAPLRDAADVLIDTSDMTPHDLRAALSGQFAIGHTVPLSITVHSFSYKRGLPQGLDMVFDCRFLRNPHWSAELRELDGRHAAVATYVQADPRFDEFYGRVEALADHLLPAYLEEGKAYLGWGFGCTGGQHRSVALAEKFAETLGEKGWSTFVRHQELERRGRLDPSKDAGDAA